MFRQYVDRNIGNDDHRIDHLPIFTDLTQSEHDLPQKYIQQASAMS